MHQDNNVIGMLAIENTIAGSLLHNYELLRFDEATELDAGPVLDLCAQKDVIVEGGEHHLQGRNAPVGRITVLADDGDPVGLCLQHIAVVIAVEICGFQGEGILIGIGALAGTVHAQQDVEFAIHGGGHDRCADPVFGQNLGKILLGCVIDTGFVHDIYLTADGEFGAVVSDLPYDGVNIVGFFCLGFRCCCDGYG